MITEVEKQNKPKRLKKKKLFNYFVIDFVEKPSNCSNKFKEKQKEGNENKQREKWKRKWEKVWYLRYLRERKTQACES